MNSRCGTDATLRAGRGRSRERGPKLGLADLGFEAKAGELRESYMSEIPQIHGEAAEQVR
jgi:hypothetical protein